MGELRTKVIIKAKYLNYIKYLLFRILLLQVLSCPLSFASQNISGTYYIHEWGQDDSNGDDFKGILKATFFSDAFIR